MSASEPIGILYIGILSLTDRPPLLRHRWGRDVLGTGQSGRLGGVCGRVRTHVLGGGLALSRESFSFHLHYVSAAHGDKVNVFVDKEGGLACNKVPK